MRASSVVNCQDLLPQPSSLDQALATLEADDLPATASTPRSSTASWRSSASNSSATYGWVTDWERSECRLQL